MASGGHFLCVRSLDILNFIQMATDIATALYYTGIDPFTKQEVYVAMSCRISASSSRTLVSSGKR